MYYTYKPHKTLTATEYTHIQSHTITSSRWIFIFVIAGMTHDKVVNLSALRRLVSLANGSSRLVTWVRIRHSLAARSSLPPLFL